MLVLSRKAGESIVIGDDITITVQALKGDIVRLSIDAPREVPILRGELKAARELNVEAQAPDAGAISALGALLSQNGKDGE